MNFKIMTMAVLALAMVAVFGAQAFNSSLPETDNDWLVEYIDEEVVCVFINDLPVLGAGIKAKLRYFCDAGIVLEWNEEEAFYPFSNIIWIKPAKDVKWGALNSILKKR